MNMMKPISKEKRRVVNIHSGQFRPFVDETGREDGEVLQINPNKETGYGFHIYRMPPGHLTTAHTHKGDEEFYILEGEIIDHDGYRYKQGDLVWLAAETKHNSYSPEGALIVVYYR